MGMIFFASVSGGIYFHEFDKFEGRHVPPYIVGNVFMFGGCDDAQPYGPTNDMFLLQMSGTEFEWARVEAPDDGPAPRWKHSACMVDDLNLMVFAGFHSATNRFNDVWYFNIVTMEWSRPAPIQSEFTPRGNHPPAQWPNCPAPRGGPIMKISGGSVPGKMPPVSLGCTQ